MAAKPVAAAETEKPPAYEISPKLILKYQTLNFIVGIVATFCSFKYENLLPVFIYFGLHILILEVQYLAYFYGGFYNTASKVYHPDLLQEKEFHQLKRRFENAENKINSYGIKTKNVPAMRFAKHKETFDTLKPIFEEQIKLRTVCWFKWLISAPISVAEEKNCVTSVEEKVIKKDATSVKKTTAFAKPSDDGNESDFSESDDELDSQSDNSLSDDSELSAIYVPKIKSGVSADNNLKKRNQDISHLLNVYYNQPKYVAFDHEAVYSFKEDSEVAAASKLIKFEIKQSQLKTIENKQSSIEKATENLKTAEKVYPKNDDLEEIYRQFAEMKAENEILKNSLEKLIAAQTVF